MEKTNELKERTPLEEIRSIQRFFKDIKNRPQLQIPSPKTAYLWKNISRELQCALVLRDGKIAELKKDLNLAIGEMTYTHKTQGKQSVNEHISKNPIDAMIIIEKGTIVYERYKTMRSFDKHNWFSSGKTIVSALIALLVEEGKIVLTESVSDYLAELKGSVWDTVTINEVLDMTTGLDSTEHDELKNDSRTNPERGWFQWVVSLGLFPDQFQRNHSVFDVLRTIKRVKPAGVAFEYNSINTWILEMIVEQVSAQPISEFFSERVWRKMGAQGDGYISVTPEGYPMTFGFMSSTLRDFGRYGMLYTPSWNKVSEQKIISDAYIERIQTSGVGNRYEKGFFGKEMLGMLEEVTVTNSNQWDVVFSDGDFYKQGVGGQGLYVSPRLDLVMAWFCTGGNDELTMARAIALSNEWN